jgi:hypothetical protein
MDGPASAAHVSGRTSTDRCDAIVLGAGVSGLVSASVLLGQGYKTVFVVDEYAHVGGNHIDWARDDYTFDIGSLIFQDDSPLLKHFPELLERYVPILPDWARLNPQGVITAYPVSIRDDILAAGPVEVAKIIASALYARLFQRRMRNAREFARHWMGARLLKRSGLDAYMTRFYGVPSTEIDIQLARKRMLWISEQGSLRAIARRLSGRKPAPATNRQLARPRQGFGYLYAAAVGSLTARGAVFVTGARLRRLERLDDGFNLTCDDRQLVAGRVVSTIPIRQMETLCGLDVSEDLETITLLTLYFSFAGRRGFKEAIIYNFSYHGAWKRLTMYSDFYGLAHGREYFAVEIIANHIDGCRHRAEADFRSHAAANGLFAGDLVLEGSQFLENAYPIYKNAADETAAAAIRALQNFGVESFGRHGGFNYQPTARVSTLESEAALRVGGSVSSHSAQ